MLLFFTTSMPDILLVVSQCARFTHCPKAQHGVAVKHILRYLAGTKDKGMYLNPINNMKLDCYVDADFAGLWGWNMTKTRYA